MSNSLPSYLQFHTDGSALLGSVVVEGDIRITAITPRLIRIEQGAWTDAATLTVLNRAFCPVSLQIERSAEGLTIETGALSIRLRKGLPLEEGLQIARDAAPAFLWRFGEKPHYNLKGTVSTLDTIDGDCPLEDGVCSRDGFAFFEDGSTLEFTQEGWFAPRREETDVYFFGYGHDYAACVQDFQRLTGGPSLLPAFSLGNWWSRYHAYTQEEYLTLMDRFAANDVPLSVGIIDMDWHITSREDQTYGEGWTGYTWNEALFPDPASFLKGLHARGLKTALNLHPALGVRPYEKPYEKMAELMGRKDGKTIPFNCLSPKFLKAYFEALHFPMEEQGVDFWWMDWQQGNDYEAIAGDSLDDEGRKLASISPLWMLNHMHHLAGMRSGGRGMVFSRYAGYGSARNPIGFSGDVFSTWRSLRFQPYFTATASNVGYGWWSHDIGGHMCGIRNDELTTRWVQLGVFSPILRLHSTSHPFNTREPWYYNRRAEETMERFMRLRHQLFPYLYTMNRRSSEELLPLVVPMYHLYPEQDEAYAVPNEYGFGTEMLAAPITSPADASDLATTQVWLPEGLWTDAMTGLVYPGGQSVAVCRPLEEMPVFLKAGALVLMQRHTPGSNALGNAEAMELYVAPGASGAFTLYEDDGETMDYRRGHFCETPIAMDWTSEAATLSIAPARGDTALIPAERSWEIHLRGFRPGCAVRMNGAALRGEYDAQTATLTIRVSAKSAEGLSLSIANADGLTFDDNDIRRRVMDRIMRAQISLREKSEMLEAFDQALAMVEEGKAYWKDRLMTDLQPNLGLALIEMLEQRKRIIDKKL